MEGKDIVFWIVLAAGCLAFALYIVVNMHSHGRACFGRRKKPADVEHGNALSELSAARQSSAATLFNNSLPTNAGGANSQQIFPSLVSATCQSSAETLANDSPLPYVCEANSQPGNLPTTMTEMNGQPDNLPTVVTETNGQSGNETKRKSRRFGGKNDLQPLRLVKHRFGGKKDLEPLRLAHQTHGTVGQSVQSACPTRLERDGEEADLGIKMPWSAR